MTRAQWQELRLRKEWPLELFYNYWKEVKKPHHIELKLEEFEFLMGAYMERFHQSVHYNSSGEAVVYDPSSAVMKIMKYYDKKFNISE